MELTWTEVTDLPSARRICNGFRSITTAALSVGGQTSTGPYLADT